MVTLLGELVKLFGCKPLFRILISLGSITQPLLAVIQLSFAGNYSVLIIPRRKMRSREYFVLKLDNKH
jgi:hypothetical protein